MNKYNNVNQHVTTALLDVIYPIYAFRRADLCNCNESLRSVLTHSDVYFAMFYSWLVVSCYAVDSKVDALSLCYATNINLPNLM